MMTAKKKAAGGFKTTTATATHNATDFIAAGAREASAEAAFHAFPCTGIGRTGKGAAKGCATVLFGARHTTKQAGNLPDSEVFSRSEFDAGLTFQGSDGYGAGSAYPQGRQHNLFSVDIPSSTLRPIQPHGGLSVQQGTKTMTTVNTITTPKTGNTATLARQQAIENALTTALYFIRLPNTDPAALRAATGRAIRAASMLKQACAEIQNGGAA